MVYKRQCKRPLVSFIMCPYSSVFGFLGGVRRWEVDGLGGYIKDIAILGSALKRRRRQPERLLCQNQTLTVNNVILLLIIASF